MALRKPNSDAADDDSGHHTRSGVRWALITAAFCAALGIVTSFRSVRALMIYPLYVHETGARGDAAYVMADGYAYWARLRAAADLYHMNRVPRIYILSESFPAGYDFVGDRLETQTERAIRYLDWQGVPREAISRVPVHGSTTFGSLSEARSFAHLRLPDLRDCVVVTSAPHTRRSRLSFARSLPTDVRVHPYASSGPHSSEEIFYPIWLEYVKLFVYFFIA
jgi:uncharacterized SAM-binding protein YcdF (DUF218 family)